MSAWTLAAAAVLTGLTVSTGPQSGAGGHAVAAQGIPAPAVEISAQKRVSVSFSHASEGEVLEWLSKNGADFIAADSEIPKDVSITMSVQDQPIGEVADALASAMGGHWERRGGIRVFRKGEGFGFFSPQGLDEVRAFGQGNGRVRTFTVPGARAFGGGGKEPFMTPDVRVFETPQWKDQFKDLPKIDAPAQKELEEAMRARAWDSKDVEKSMAEARKAMERARKEHPEAFRDGQNWGTFVVPGQGDAFIYRNAKPARGFGQPRVFTPSITVRDGDVTRLLESLSPDQREMNRRQGYLRVRDLTEAQRRMLGLRRDSKDFTITINRNGESLTIKSDD